MKRSSACAGVIFCSLLCLVPAHGQTGSLRFPESRSYSPGKMWLGWTPQERTWFVKGFIVGHDDGYRSGCAAARASFDSKQAGSKTGSCLQQRHLFRKDVAFYEQFITSFYDKYPMDRDVPFRVLLLQADEKTPDEVHRWLASKSD